MHNMSSVAKCTEIPRVSEFTTFSFDINLSIFRSVLHLRPTGGNVNFPICVMRH